MCILLNGCISVQCQMSFHDTELVSMRARKEIGIVFPSKLKKGIACEQFLFYLFLQWIKYTDLKILRPLIHSSFYSNLLIWRHYCGLFFFGVRGVCMYLGTVSIRFFSIIGSCSLCSVTRCMAVPVICFLNTKRHSLSTPNNPNWLYSLAAW